MPTRTFIPEHSTRADASSGGAGFFSHRPLAPFAGEDLMRIDTIPMDVLIQDRCESLMDIEICSSALAQGITHHRDGMPVQYRIDVNRRIVELINEEIDRRANALILFP